MFSTVFTFKGRTAHGAVSPWSGQSALDAVELMNVATNFLREHLFYTYRMHYVIIEGGEAPNVVPDRASVWYFIRNTDERVEEMYEKVINCAKAAALATGTELVSIRCLTALHQRHNNKSAAELFQKNIELVGMPEWSEEEHNFAKALQKELGKEEKGMPTEVDTLKAPDKFVGGGSSDVGDVTLITPTATIRFPGAVPGAIGHHWSTVSCGYGSTAWKGLNVVRQYVVPSNPKTTLQTTQRAYVTAAVAMVHTAQALAAQPLDSDDQVAYSALASAKGKIMTWFNMAVKLWVDVKVATDTPVIYRNGTVTDKTAANIIATLWLSEETPSDLAAGKFYFGTSKTNLINSKVATVTAGDNVQLFNEDCSAFLTAGVKYYWQFRPDAGDPCVGADSGIYNFVAE